MFVLGCSWDHHVSRLSVAFTSPVSIRKFDVIPAGHCRCVCNGVTLRRKVQVSLCLPLISASQDIDAVFFGDGIENDLEDWSSFLEVPDFMTTFSNSQVRAHTLLLRLHAIARTRYVVIQ